MKIEFELEPRDIEAFAQRVVELLKTWLAEVANLAEGRLPKAQAPTAPRPDRKTGEYWDKKTVGEYLGISPNSISNWICKGETPFPYAKIGRTVRFKKSDVIEWAESKRIKASYDERLPRQR